MTRGQLRIHLGASPGVGKTYAMLQEGARRSTRGADVVIGVVETHGRAGTVEQLGSLEVVAPRVIEHRGVHLAELDVDAVLARRPDVVLVDELAHTNAPGSRHEKRWADIDELLDAGIDVVSTLNIQHLESLNDVVERITGVVQRETVPDAWVRRAEQIELVDMTPEALRRRMAHGNVYPPERIDAALANFFRPGNLAALRELALLWTADRVEDQLQDYLEAHRIAAPWETRERVMVALTGAPGNDRIVRRAARIAARQRAELVGVHVVAADGRRPVGSELVAHRQLLEELGGTFREVVGDDVAAALVTAARSDRATQIVIGASRRSRRQELTGGSVVNRLMRLARDLDVHVISTDPVAGSTMRRPSPRASALPPRRRLIGWGLVVVGLPLITLLLVTSHDELGITTMLLATLGYVVVVSAVGGLAPGLVAAVVGGALVNFHAVPPTGSLAVRSPENVLALVVFIAVAATIATLVDRVSRRSVESAVARADAEALARAAATQATELDPLPALVDELRRAIGVAAISVLRVDGAGGWEVVASSGESPPSGPDDGTAVTASRDGTMSVVYSGDVSARTELVDSFLDQLAVALERRRLQGEASAAAALAEADALRTGILQAVSHDLRTPLAGIKASVTSLLAPDVDFDETDTEEFLRTIDVETDRLDRVVGNLLDMGRLQTGSLRVLRRATALEEVVSAASSNLGVAAGAVDIDVPETLPLLDVDGALLERAVANVLANALVVQPEGRPVRIEAASVPGAVLLQIVDNGPGIPEHDRSGAVEPFQRLGDRSNQAGVGLGLAIAHGFTRAIGGTLELDDTSGGGLTARFLLPVLADDAVVAS